MPLRVQGAFLSSQEVQDVVSFVKEHNEAYFDDSVSDYINNKNGGFQMLPKKNQKYLSIFLSSVFLIFIPFDFARFLILILLRLKLFAAFTEFLYAVFP